MADDFIRVKGARVHNLKNLDVNIPKDKLVVITGVSGSGKSSLAFDTIYAEGQRRYVESLSAYARQFLGLMDKPDVDNIEGLSPAISIDQKTASHNPRSTVGTVTEIYDYLRLLYARVGHPHSPVTGHRLQSQTVQEIVDHILGNIQNDNTKVIVLAPVVKNRKGTYEELFSRFLSQGYVRARVDGEYFSLEEEISLDRYKKHNIEVVVDRLVLSKESDESIQKRVTDSIETALNLAAGEILVNYPEINEEKFYSENLVDPETGESFPQIEPHSFSFNSPHGACEECNGLGFINNIDPETIYNPNLSISEGAIYPWMRVAENPDSWDAQILAAVARDEGFDLRAPMKNFTEDQKKILFYGGKKKYRFSYVRQTDGMESQYERAFEGVVNNLLRRYKETESKYVRTNIEQYMKEVRCSLCEGKRLKSTSLSVTIGRKNIYDVGELSIAGFYEWMEELVDKEKSDDKVTNQELEIANQVIKEIKARTNFLLAVGLNYLTLNRTAKTLSGGESQRIRLASQIGTGLSGVLYVLDEPSIGLHQRDNSRLLKSLKELKELGNTVVIVEHDEDTIRESDYVIDIGPRAGEHGGELVAEGVPDEFIKYKNSLTADYLSGRKSIDKASIEKRVKEIVPKYELAKTKPKGKLEVKGARHNNLKSVNIEVPLGKFVVVTGVSGSGKSSLINEVLYPAAMKHLHGSKVDVGLHDEILGLEKIDKVINIDQSPIGRTPRSNPVTYTGAFTAIRELFSNTKEAKERGYAPGRFSFNTKGGRCENCQGDGVLKIEMQFLPDVHVTCDVCNGKRYNRETLQVDYRGKNISDVLDMTIESALEFFKNIPSIKNKLQSISDVGLGYIRLGQPATTLSGGEAQRVKLASELGKRSTGKTLYILDEPTTGLHFEDINNLLVVLHSLVAKGNTILSIEHNLDYIKTADWLIDLGPEGGDAGGTILTVGSPKDVSNDDKSYTGQWLKKIMK